MTKLSIIGINNIRTNGNPKVQYRNSNWCPAKVLLQKLFFAGVLMLSIISSAVSSADDAVTNREGKDVYKDHAVYIYALSQKGDSESYDESMVVACLQGIINRESPMVYVVSTFDKWPEYWLWNLSTLWAKYQA